MRFAYLILVAAIAIEASFVLAGPAEEALDSVESIGNKVVETTKSVVKKAPKIKRTIRVRETSPESEDEQSKAKVGVTTGDSKQSINVNPNINVGVPAAVPLAVPVPEEPKEKPSEEAKSESELEKPEEKKVSETLPNVVYRAPITDGLAASLSPFLQININGEDNKRPLLANQPIGLAPIPTANYGILPYLGLNQPALFKNFLPRSPLVDLPTRALALANEPKLSNGSEFLRGNLLADNDEELIKGVKSDEERAKLLALIRSKRLDLASSLLNSQQLNAMAAYPQLQMALPAAIPATMAAPLAALPGPAPYWMQPPTFYPPYYPAPYYPQQWAPPSYLPMPPCKHSLKKKNDKRKAKRNKKPNVIVAPVIDPIPIITTTTTTTTTPAPPTTTTVEPPTTIAAPKIEWEYVKVPKRKLD